MITINEYLFGQGIQSTETPLDADAAQVVRPRPSKKKTKKEIAEELRSVLESNDSDYEPLPEYIHRIHATYSLGSGNPKRETFEVKTPIRHPFGAYDIVKKQLKNKGYNVHYLEHGGSSKE